MEQAAENKEQSVRCNGDWR